MNVSLDYKYTYRQDHNAAESGYNGSRTVLQEYTQDVYKRQIVDWTNKLFCHLKNKVL